jgi:hypothetical protein
VLTVKVELEQMLDDGVKIIESVGVGLTTIAMVLAPKQVVLLNTPTVYTVLTDGLTEIEELELPVLHE